MIKISRIKFRRTYNHAFTNNTINSNENDQYKNLRRIKRLKNSLGNPKYARNVMDINNLRNNRFTSMTHSARVHMVPVERCHVLLPSVTST